MPCSSCGVTMRDLGVNPEGKQYFECHQDGCHRRYTLVARWWESGTSFHVEDVPH